MKNKNDKIKIVFIVFLLYFVLSWLIEGGIYSSTGEFTSVGIIRMGLFDIISIIYSSFYYKIIDIMFLLGIGGCYQVLSGTDMYRRLVDKVSNFIKGKEEIFMVVITTLMALYASICNNILVLFMIAPFIVTLFLRNNYNRLVAFSAGFGGMFLGYIGLTYGNYNVSYINQNLGIGTTDWIVQKWVILLIALVIYNVFSILYMKKHKNVIKDQEKYDMFITEPMVEKKSKKKDKKKVWPLVLIGTVSLICILLGYISWNDSFNISLFDNIYTSMNNGLVIADIPIVSSILGTTLTAFGTYSDLLVALFIMIIGIIVVGLVSKIKFNNFLNTFGNGMMKMGRVAFIYGLATSIIFLISNYPWPISLINGLLGSGTFNIIILLLIVILAMLFVGDGNLVGFLFSSGFGALFTSNLVEAGIILRLGSAIVTFVGPTSYLLLACLTYLNIPYKAWLKYISKFLISFIFIILITLAVIIYV